MKIYMTIDIDKECYVTVFKADGYYTGFMHTKERDFPYYMSRILISEVNLFHTLAYKGDVYES